MTEISNDQLLQLLRECLRTTPDRGELLAGKAETQAWVGRVNALLKRWKGGQSIESEMILFGSSERNPTALRKTYKQITAKINEAIFDLQLSTGNFETAVIDEGSVFDYFDQIRDLVTEAQSDIYFIDPYINEEFVSRYGPLIPNGVSLRLLTSSNSKQLQALIAGLKLCTTQYDLTVEVRSTGNLHDRYLFIDGIRCFQSGASFKDGAKKSMTTVTRIVDAFPEMHASYEDKWSAADKQNLGI